MNPVQTNLSEATLVNAIRGNLCDFFRYLANRLPPGDRFENDRFVRWYTPLLHAWFNGFLCSASPTSDDREIIQATIQYFTERRVETFSCWLEPPLQRSDWETFLSEYSFDFSDGTPGMAVDLHTFPETPAMPDGLEIRAVEDKSMLRAWAHVFTIGYGMPPAWEDMIFDVWDKMGLDFPVRNYLGYLNGEPISTSTVFYSAGVAGIYDVATLPEARGRGLLAPL
jgi:hypothetical protein